jgi:hypothetical protein
MKRRARIGRTAAAAWLGLVALPAAAQEAPPPGTLGAEPPAAGRYQGVASCASSNCHGATRPQDAYPVLQNEFHTWSRDDSHSEAYIVLLGERSTIIARNLGLRAPEQAQRCLDCHALTPPAGAVAGRLEIEDGVTCESCHGPASGWLEGHRSEGWSHADSVATGLRDLRDPAVRAGLCMSCHVGTAGREVDHELIAAGHPALVFELDNYAAAMPPHWPPAGAYDDPDRAREAAAGRGARAWALGQARGLRQRLELLARRARTGPWPELAELRCDDCHHSLAEERWRLPDRGRVVGEPAWNDDRWRVLRPLVAEAAPERLEELNARVPAAGAAAWKLNLPAAEAARLAEEAAAAIAEIEPALAALAWDEGRIRDRLARYAASDPIDYDGAAQTLFAVNTLAAELIARRPGLAGSGLAAAIDALDRALESRAGYDHESFEALLQRLGEEVRRLPR